MEGVERFYLKQRYKLLPCYDGEGKPCGCQKPLVNTRARKKVPCTLHGKKAAAGGKSIHSAIQKQCSKSGIDLSGRVCVEYPADQSCTGRLLSKGGSGKSSGAGGQFHAGGCKKKLDFVISKLNCTGHKCKMVAIEVQDEGHGREYRKDRDADKWQLANSEGIMVFSVNSEIGENEDDLCCMAVEVVHALQCDECKNNRNYVEC